FLLCVGAWCVNNASHNPQTEVAEIDSLEEITSAYGDGLLAERLTNSGVRTTAVRLSYAQGGNASDPAAWNTLSITGDYNGQTFTLDCDFDSGEDRKAPAGAYTVTQYGNVDVAIYREESDWSDPNLYRAEFTLDGVAYDLSIHSNDPKDIFTYLDMVLGEPQGNGNTSGATLTDVLGLGVCRIEMEEITPHQYLWRYYVEVNGEDVCVAEQFGFDEPESWSRDLDGDGVPELICNNTYGDGAQLVSVYRNNNGIIEEGSVRWAYYREEFGWTNIGEGGVSSQPVERYDPERDIFTATDYYINGYDTPVTVEFADGLTPFDFLPFTHLP
ncbi:MAG: hypothetical protein K2K53_00420, partial [Oscillospiraceae bacterium]|nr:hypothetical protein [Oscillospiraceae bacterium]